MTNFYNPTTVNEEAATDELFVLGLEGKDVVSDFEEIDCSAALEAHSVDPADCEFAIRVSTFIEQALKGHDCGVWLDPDSYSTYEDFISACKEVHGAESKPQFKYVEFRGVPKRFITEDSLRRELWDHLSEWGTLDEGQRVLVENYREHFRDTATIDEVEATFIGCFDHARDLGWLLLESTGQLDAVPEGVRPYIDTASYAEDRFLDGDLSWFSHNMKLWAFWRR